MRYKWLWGASALAVLVVLALLLRPGGERRSEQAQARLRVQEQFIGLMNSGRNYLDQGQAASALEAFAAASRLHPGDRDVWLNLANARLLGAEAREAIAAAESALAIDRHSAAGHYLKGCGHLRLGEFEEAARSLQSAKDLDRTVNAASFQLGRAQLGLGQNEAAAGQFREVVQFDPQHRAGWYSLSQAQIRLGDEEGAAASLERVQALAQEQGEQVSGPEVFERCVYTRAVVPFRLEQPAHEGIAVRFEEATSEMLGPEASSYRWPAGVIDAGHDGTLDLLVQQEGRGTALLRGGPGGLVPEGSPAPLGGGALPESCLVGDLQIETLIGERRHEDALLAGGSALRLLQVTYDGLILDRTLQSGVGDRGLAEAVLSDLDFTGKLDLVGLDPQDGSLSVLGNRGGFLFVDAREEYSLPEGAPPLRQFRLEDWDGDDLPDLLFLTREGAPGLWLRERGLAFRADPGLDGLPRARAMAVGDLDNDLRPDLLLALEEGIHVHLQGAAVPPARIGTPEPVLGMRLLDYDNDGWLDLLAWGPAGLRAWRNRGLEGFQETTAELGLGALAGLSVRALKGADLDGDCDTDLLLGLEDGSLRFLRNQGGDAHRQLKVRLAGSRTNPSALGVKLEVAAGGLRLIRTVRELPVEIGLGDRSRLEVLKPHWSDLVTTADVEVGECQTVEVVELELPTGSCPYLYVWDGSGFRFVSDFLGASPLGLPAARGRLIAADTDEYIRLGSSSEVGLQEGDWVVQVTEELREVLYLDLAQLHVVDVPAGVEVHASNRLVPSPPFPEAGLQAVHRSRPLLSARRSDGADATSLLIEADGRRASPVRLRAPQLRGLAEPWHVDLDFGPIDEERDWVLVLEGWLRFGGGMSNMSGSHFGDFPFPFPVLSARREDGSWEALDVAVGAPAGKTKSMAVRLGGVLRPGMRLLRLSTAFEIHWDRIALMEAWDGEMVRRTLRPRVADLHWRGFSRYLDLPWDEPLTPDYRRTVSRAPWTVMPSGWCTRYGPVGELLEEIDDRLVLLSGGDELTLRFDAGEAPGPGPGMARELFLLVDGWDKDADLHVVEGWNVEPLPWHGMDDQLYGRQERPASLPSGWIGRYNTRWTPPFLLHRK